MGDPAILLLTTIYLGTYLSENDASGIGFTCQGKGKRRSETLTLTVKVFTLK